MKSIFAIVCLLPLVVSYGNYNPSNQCKLINGGWGEWSEFGPCSKTCGKGGIQARQRYCNAPIPKYGGKDCVGNKVEVKKCDDQVECPVDGGWGQWIKFPCTKTCGGGEIIYKRYCDHPKPKHCGKPCIGNMIKKEPCNQHYCPINGGWTKWECGKCKKTSYGKCLKYCKRSCTNPKPQYGGANCVGASQEHQKCDDYECPKPTTTTTTTTPYSPCQECYLKAEKYANDYGKPDFVGHACRVDKSYCDGLNGGINEQYPANHWFFLTCSADGPWCKPCATRNLVYNPKCGQCEKKKDSKCTGPTKPTYKPITSKPTTTKEITTKKTTTKQHYPWSPCQECYLKAEKYANAYGKPDFVGHACRVDKSYCYGLNGGINKQYPANHWFFLTCSADGPWCKPCATRNLVYNPKCGQCEKKKDSKSKKPTYKPATTKATTKITITTKQYHPYNPCQECYIKAEKYANDNGKPDFVGHACRVDKSYCYGRNGGINEQYPAKYWFFLTCSADGPWCKPCATRNLVYNPKCGQCEKTRDSKCTGPMMWRNGKDDEINIVDDLENDDEFWRK